MVKTCLLPISILFGLFFSSCGGPQDGTYSFEILSTNDLHGTFFDSTYVGKRIKKSLYAVKWTVDSVRTAAGREHVILLDGGDILQGDNAAYYFNYVDTLSPHVFPRMAAYLGYDAVTVGNHDIETGHSVYDRVAKELNAEGIPFLAGNAFRTDNGKTYFPGWKLIKRKGIRILVLGYTNPNVKNWLAENLWSGMTFQSLLPLVQQDVDRLRARLKPHLVIVSVHSGTGEGDGKSLENQGMDLYRTLRGVDFLFCAHDHQPVVFRTIPSASSMPAVTAGLSGWGHLPDLPEGEVRTPAEGLISTMPGSIRRWPRSSMRITERSKRSRQPRSGS